VLHPREGKRWEILKARKKGQWRPRLFSLLRTGEGIRQQRHIYGGAEQKPTWDHPAL